MTNQGGGESPLFPPEDRVNVISVACQSPEKYGFTAQTHWSISTLRQALIFNGFFKEISWTTVQRFLSNGDIKPHRMDYYLFCKDPDLIKIAKKICRIYLNPPKDRVVISYDERSGTQALERPFASSMKPGKPARQDFEYIRHGVIDVMAGFDIRTGKVFAGCYRRHRTREVLSFLKRLVKHYGRKKILLIMDNLRVHKTAAIQEWIAKLRGKVEIVFTPKHASWLNQVELWFRTLNQRCLKRLSVRSAAELVRRVMAWVRTYNKRSAHPYNWRSKGILCHA